MKKNKLLLLILLIFIALAVYFYATKKPSTLNDIEGALSTFAVDDTATIDKIFIADAMGKSVTLSLKNGVWMVNDKFIARPDNIKLLMKTFGRIAVKSPVPKSAFNNIVKSIATASTKVEIYQGQNMPSKVYYVGGATLDHQGTYMLLEEGGVKSTVPFITHIPGFYGYLTTRFFTEAEQWRDAIVFKYPANQITSIKMNYYETPDQSFIINKNGNNYSLTGLDSDAKLNVDTNVVKEYLERYEKVYYEMIDVESSKQKVDSVINSTPFFSIEIKTISGAGDKIVAYHMPNYRKVMGKDQQEAPYDVDRMYGYLNDELFTLIQFATFDNLRLPKDYFLIRK